MNISQIKTTLPMKYPATRVGILLLLAILGSCELPHQPGPMPTEIVETVFQPGLNVIGVLRADGESGTSFITINRALTTEEIYSDSIENFSPQVDFVRAVALGTGAVYDFRQATDSTDQGTYRDSSLSVEAGAAFDLAISAPGFPLLTGTTQVPEKPELVPGSLVAVNDEVSFQLERCTGAFEYKLYLIFDTEVLEKVVRPFNRDTIEISWEFSTQLGAPVLLMLAALDENLTRYGNSPISFIPNTYHLDGSTVSGGYGCFGSVAITTYAL